MLIRLVVLDGAAQGRVFLIGPGETLTIGRGEDSDAVILDRRLSRQHFAVAVAGDTLTVRDLQSRNGTQLNGKPVAEATARPGDRITAGNHLFTVETVREEDSRSASTTTRLIHARLLGPYRIETILGQGAAGAVYLAQHTGTQKRVALKVLEAAGDNDPDTVRRFHQAGEAALGLAHPHLVRTLEVGELRGVHYLAMEYVPGHSVGDLLRVHGRVPWDRTVSILHQIADALCYLHNAGLVHRDVKPDNMLVGPTGRAQLTDLGLAKIQGGAGGNDITGSGTGLGTPHYIPPEQIHNARAVDIRSDIYSLGASAFHMLAGRPPFQAQRMHQLISAIRDREAPTLTAVGATVPGWVEEMVMTMLAKDLRYRYQDPRHVVALLQAHPEAAIPAAPGTDGAAPPGLETNPCIDS